MAKKENPRFLSHETAGRYVKLTVALSPRDQANLATLRASRCESVGRGMTDDELVSIALTLAMLACAKETSRGMPRLNWTHDVPPCLDQKECDIGEGNVIGLDTPHPCDE